MFLDSNKIKYMSINEKIIEKIEYYYNNSENEMISIKEMSNEYLVCAFSKAIKEDDRLSDKILSQEIIRRISEIHE